MAKPRVPQNLPPESQQWVRDVERRLNDLETENQRLTRSVTQNAGQIGNIMSALYNSSPIVLMSQLPDVYAGSYDSTDFYLPTINFTPQQAMPNALVLSLFKFKLIGSGFFSVRVGGYIELTQGSEIIVEGTTVAGEFMVDEFGYSNIGFPAFQVASFEAGVPVTSTNSSPFAYIDQGGLGKSVQGAIDFNLIIFPSTQRTD